MELDFSKHKYNKFKGTSPEGFVLVPYEMLEELKNFETWVEFKNSDLDWMEKKSAEIYSTRNQE